MDIIRTRDKRWLATTAENLSPSYEEIIQGGVKMSNRRAKCPYGHNALFIRIKDRHFFPPNTAILCQTCQAYYDISGKKTGDFKDTL